MERPNKITAFTAVYTTLDQSPMMVQNFMRFRKLLFIDRLRWDLSPSGEFERDDFDHQYAEYAILLYKGWIIGGFRATPMNRPNLSRDVFGHLASERSLPRSPDHLEISRFGIMTEDDPDLKVAAGMANYAMLFHHATRRGALGLVALADLQYERFLRLMRIRTRRYGEPVRHEMGSPNNTIELVLGDIPVGSEAFRLPKKFAEAQKKMEFHDEISDAHDVRGREAVPA